MTGLEQDTELIRALLRYAGVPAAQVAKKAKLDAKTVRKPEIGAAEARLSQTTLEKLRAAYPDFPGWTRGGEWMEPSSPQPYAGDVVELEQVDLRYGMGGTFADSAIEVQRRSFSREWLRSITTTPPQHLFWAIGRGDSMEPTIRSGEIVLMDRSQLTPRMDDEIWAVTHGDIGMVRRLRLRPDGTVELHSDNDVVRPQVAVDGELHVIGRVIAVVRRL